MDIHIRAHTRHIYIRQANSSSTYFFLSIEHVWHVITTLWFWSDEFRYIWIHQNQSVVMTCHVLYRKKKVSLDLSAMCQQEAGTNFYFYPERRECLITSTLKVNKDSVSILRLWNEIVRLLMANLCSHHSILSYIAFTHQWSPNAHVTQRKHLAKFNFTYRSTMEAQWRALNSTSSLHFELGVGVTLEKVTPGHCIRSQKVLICNILYCPILYVPGM